MRPASGHPSMTFSTTVMASTSMKCWWIIPTPRAIASAGLCLASGSPRRTIEPASGAIRPNSTFMSVLFPEPFSPKSPRISPAFSSRSTPSTARTAPKLRTTPCITRMGAMILMTVAMTLVRVGHAAWHPEGQALAAAARVLLRRRDLQRPGLELRRHVVKLLHHRGGHDRIERLGGLVLQRGAGHGRCVVAILNKRSEQFARLHLIGGASEHRPPVLNNVC